MTSHDLPKAPVMHGCVRCGRPVAVELALCEVCNPLGLKQPAASQVHALAAGGIVLFVLFLAVVGRSVIGAIGPFSGEIRALVPAPGGLVVTLAVTNAGTRSSSTTCRIVEASHPAGGPGQLLQTPNVPGGSTIEFSAPISLFGDQPVDLAVDCQSP